MICPFCKEEIKDGAIKCKHCGSMLGNFSTEQSIPFAQEPRVNNALAWLIAFSPIIYVFIQSALHDTGFIVTSVILYIAIIIDAFIVHKAGYEIMGWQILIYPLYLYKRYTTLKQKNTYFLVNIILLSILIVFLFYVNFILLG